MDFNGLRAFLAVADKQSFSKAAEQLHLTQPAVSKRVAVLESQLNTTLFDRISRKVQLTEAGHTLLPRARALVVELEDCRRALSRLTAPGGTVSGRLSVATSHHIGLHRLPPILREYVGGYPDVELDLHFMDSEEGCLAVERGDLELAIVTLPSQSPERLTAIEIWQDPLVVIVAKNHPLANVDKPDLHDLSRYPAILPSSATYTHAIVRQAFEALNVELSVRLETNYLETIHMMVSIGLGWSTLPLTMVTDEIVSLELPELALQRRLGAVFHSDRTLSNAGEAMLSLLRNEVVDSIH